MGLTRKGGDSRLTEALVGAGNGFAHALNFRGEVEVDEPVAVQGRPADAAPLRVPGDRFVATCGGAAPEVTYSPLFRITLLI